MSQDAASIELATRKAWTLAKLGESVKAGRSSGWLRGDPMPGVRDAAQLLHDRLQLDAEATPMRVLASRLGLCVREVDLLWLLVCIELEPLLSQAAQLLVSPGMTELNAQILSHLIPPTPDAAGFDRLVQLGLIEMSMDPRVPEYRRAIRAHDRVIELARGLLVLDAQLREIATLVTAIESRRTTTNLPLDRLPALSAALGTETAVLVIANGAEGSGRGTVLRHAISSAGRSALLVRATALATEAEPFERQLRAVIRECRLHDAWPLFLEADCLTDRFAILDRELLRPFAGPILATTRDACTWSTARPRLAITIAPAEEPARVVMWRAALPGSADEVAHDCARRYAITPGLLAQTASAAIALVPDSTAVSVEHVHTALRGQLERRLTGLAQRIETRQTWDDLVLPSDQYDLLSEMVARVRCRGRVFEDWGFGDKVGKGQGVSALLSGAPGTGKTMIAGLVANELGLDLYQVDLSRIVSKYIGETEKQLAALFEAAESGHSILLFDEADSLFAKRTEVKSSNDRYANLEVNYLLQRMESFRGISLLTTNHETTIDKAFLRRLAFHIRVPLPDEEHRALIWQAMIPDRAPRSGDLAFDRLASEFAMSGGYIKNAVLRAAFFAADEATVITNDHLWRAARAEYEAIGKVAYQAS